MDAVLAALGPRPSRMAALKTDSQFRPTLLSNCHRLERGLVADEKCRAFRLHYLALLKVREQTGHCLARSSDHLCNFFMSKRQLHSRLSLGGFPVLDAPLHSQLPQLLSRRMR